MSSSTLTPVLAVEPIYARAVFEAILAGLGPDSSFRAQYRCDDRGAWVHDADTAGDLVWHPLCELTGPGSPDPLVEPWLPFPFNARQLAALLVDGWGHFIAEKYGDWDTGPDEDEMKSIGLLGTKAKEVLVAAYEALRSARDKAPRLDRNLAVMAQSLTDQYRDAREVAMARVQLREHRHSDTEYRARLALVNDAVAELEEPMRAAGLAANKAYTDWRRAVVQHLLLPIEDVPAAAFGDLMLKTVPASRRAEALHQMKAQQEFQDSDQGKAHWELICEAQRVESELRHWRLLRPQSVTEAVMHEAKLKELNSELAGITGRMREIESAQPASPAAIVPGAAASSRPAPDYARLATPDDLIAAFGGFGLKQNWFDDLNSRQWLLNARKVPGQGQRGRRRVPLYCPFEVMMGLVEKSRKSKLSVNAGWRILEQRFPAAYEKWSVCDPRDPPG